MDPTSLDEWLTVVPDPDEEPQPDEYEDSRIYECVNCGYMFWAGELNADRLCKACAEYLGQE